MRQETMATMEEVRTRVGLRMSRNKNRGHDPSREVYTDGEEQYCIVAVLRYREQPESIPYQTRTSKRLGAALNDIILEVRRIRRMISCRLSIWFPWGRTRDGHV